MQYNKNSNTDKPLTVKDLFYEYAIGAKPFLKWAGGKNQLLTVFNELYPKELLNGKIKNYYEPY